MRLNNLFFLFFLFSCSEKVKKDLIRVEDDQLITKEEIDEENVGNIKLNPYSMKVLENCPIELSLDKASEGVHYQFERLGYFILDLKDTKTGELVFNRTVSLRDSWAK